jgi:hypothetical protein
MEYERTHAAAIISEKRGRNFDKVKLKLYIKLFFSQANLLSNQLYYSINKPSDNYLVVLEFRLL